MKNPLSCFAILAALLLGMATVQAQNFPDRPVRVVVPFAPGNTLDNALRQVAEEFKKNTGQPIVVDNKAGGSGIIAAQNVMQAAPDGYTLLLSNTSMMTINPYTFAKLPYDPEKSFKPVTGFLGASLVLAVNAANVPANNVKEFVAWAKTQSGGVSYASFTAGNSSHFAGSQTIIEKWRAIDFEPLPFSAAEFLAFTRNDAKRWQEAVKISGFKASE
eukprot:gene12023-13938_t